MSVHSTFSGHSTSVSTTTGPSYLDEDLYMIIPSAKGNTSGKDIVSQPMIPTTSPPSQQQYVYYAIKDYRPNKEGYLRLTAGESVEVLDKSNPKEWFIATVGNEARPSEEGLVLAEVLSAEYIPVRYDSLQGEYSGSDEGRSSGQMEEPPPVPPHHPNRDETTPPATGSHDNTEEETGMYDHLSVPEKPPEKDTSTTGGHEINEEETGMYDRLPQPENAPERDVSLQAEETPSNKEESPAPKSEDTDPTASVTLEEEIQDEDVNQDEAAEDASSEQSDTTPVVSPRGSLHSGSTQSSPMADKKEMLPSNTRRSHLLTKSMTAVEINVPAITVSTLTHYGSDPELGPLSDSSPAYSIPNLAGNEGGKSPMHESVIHIEREPPIQRQE